MRFHSLKFIVPINQKKVCHAHLNAHKPHTILKKSQIWTLISQKLS